MGARVLWETPEDCLFSTKTWADGVTRTNILSKRYHGRVETPEPVPVVQAPTFGLEVPLPVLPVSDVEKAALELQSKRFSPENVAANVARLQDSVKVMSPVEEVEASMAQMRDLNERIAANEAELARLRALRDSQ
jgi:hypothetical protein